jgi:hypothetical protein
VSQTVQNAVLQSKPPTNGTKEPTKNRFASVEKIEEVVPRKSLIVNDRNKKYLEDLARKKQLQKDSAANEIKKK